MYIVIGILAGIVCGLFGTGGGLVLVPAFIYMLEIEPKKARATSLTCMLIMVIMETDQDLIEIIDLIITIIMAEDLIIETDKVEIQDSMETDH